MLELWYFTWVLLLTRPFRGYHYILPCDLALEFDPFIDLANNFWTVRLDRDNNYPVTLTSEFDLLKKNWHWSLLVNNKNCNWSFRIAHKHFLGWDLPTCIKDICPRDLGNLWNWPLSGAFVLLNVSNASDFNLAF